MGIKLGENSVLRTGWLWLMVLCLCIAVVLSQSGGWNASTRLIYAFLFFTIWLLYGIFHIVVKKNEAMVFDGMRIGLIGLAGGVAFGFGLISLDIPIIGRGGVVFDGSFFTDGLLISFASLLLVYLVLKLAILYKILPP